MSEPRCPVCGVTEVEHQAIQDVVNEMRADWGQPPLDPPDIETGMQRRDP